MKRVNLPWNQRWSSPGQCSAICLAMVLGDVSCCLGFDLLGSLLPVNGRKPTDRPSSCSLRSINGIPPCVYCIHCASSFRLFLPPIAPSVSRRRPFALGLNILCFLYLLVLPSRTAVSTSTVAGLPARLSANNLLLRRPIKDRGFITSWL